MRMRAARAKSERRSAAPDVFAIADAYADALHAQSARRDAARRAANATALCVSGGACGAQPTECSAAQAAACSAREVKRREMAFSDIAGEAVERPLSPGSIRECRREAFERDQPRCCRTA